jgi:hypothetical protein
MSSHSDSRASREQQTREADARETAWAPPNALPEPNARPGLEHRWVRTSSQGQADPVNVARSIREGWSPVAGAEYPELNIMSDHGTRWPDGVEVGGLLLCSAPAARVRLRAEHYASLTARQMQSVNDQLEADQDPRFRTMFRSHQTSVSRGFGPDARHERAPRA